KKQARHWYLLASAQDNLQSQYNLGLIYANGSGTPRDYKQAFYWWKRAAELGDTNSQYNLGVLYYKGLGIDKDEKLGMEWLQKAAAAREAQSDGVQKILAEISSRQMNGL
ncbi:MAG: tetratricopeptide repeat protein, partial [Enterovibrio sp.]